MMKPKSATTDRDLSWPALPLDAWTDTYDTLKMWTQVVGKIRLTLSPKVNHWWHVTLYVNSRGLTTSAVPYGAGAFEVQFDFLDHQLEILTSDGARKSLPLAPEVVIVGRGPDRPNGDYSNGYWSGPVSSDIVTTPMFYDAPFFGTPSYGSRRFQRRPLPRAFPPAQLTPIPSSPSVCVAQGLTSAAPPQVGSRGFVTVCPPRVR